jgi:aryl-alcohol dehydrogenase-like predicted oxidoreductase
MGQLALAWVLAQDTHIVPIPGTTRIDHLEENVAATRVSLSREMQDRLNALINQTTVSGPRYAPAVQAEIDTEEMEVPSK